MLAQRSKHGPAEPETLRRHREMFEDRLRYLRFTHGQSEKEVTDGANSPNTFRQLEEEADAATDDRAAKTAQG